MIFRIYNPNPDPLERGPAQRVSMEEHHIGERIASSKKRIIWKFILGNSPIIHNITLVHSIMSAKKNIEFDGRQQHFDANIKPGNWSFTMLLEESDHILETRINELENRDIPKYDLIINRVPFRRLEMHWPMKGNHSYPVQQYGNSYNNDYNQSNMNHYKAYQHTDQRVASEEYGIHKWGKQVQEYKQTYPNMDASNFPTSATSSFHRNQIPVKGLEDKDNIEISKNSNTVNQTIQNNVQPKKEINLLLDDQDIQQDKKDLSEPFNQKGNLTTLTFPTQVENNKYDINNRTISPIVQLTNNPSSMNQPKILNNMDPFNLTNNNNVFIEKNVKSVYNPISSGISVLNPSILSNVPPRTASFPSTNTLQINRNQHSFNISAMMDPNNISPNTSNYQRVGKKEKVDEKININAFDYIGKKQ